MSLSKCSSETLFYSDELFANPTYTKYFQIIISPPQSNLLSEPRGLKAKSGI